VPVIEPRDAPAYKQDPYVTELMRCQHTQSEIVLSLLLRKHDWNDLSVVKRTHVQAKLSQFFAIPRVSNRQLIIHFISKSYSHSFLSLTGVHFSGFGD